MSTIPADQIVQVTPNVIAAGGTALDLVAVILTTSTRVPIGVVQPFPGASAVSTYFGANSHEAAIATVYFQGFTNSNVLPGLIYYAQDPVAGVDAFLRGGNISGLSLTALQALTGSLTILVDGYTHTAASINLSAATSFSSAATIIQTALTASEPTEATVTASIAASTSSFTGSIAGNVLTISAISSGTIVNGTTLSGTGVTASTLVVNQLTGTTGGIGTYAVNTTQVVTSTTITGAYGTMTVTVLGSGNMAVGQTLTGAGVTAGTQVTALGTGTGGLGTYIVNPSQTVSSEAITGVATAPTVTFDSISGAFIITSGVNPGSAASTLAFPTGTIVASLLLGQSNGAVISQGSAAPTPTALMNSIYNVTQNWATFMLGFDPDGGSGNAQKLLFAQWNSGEANRYAFICWDTDQSPTTTVPASTSLGQLIAAQEISGTCLISEPSDQFIAAFVCGAVASIDFTEFNGRATLAFKSQAGLVAGITTQTAAQNLLLNFYNYYGAYATANETFTFFYNGSISGSFQWLDSYINQIWLNNAFQLALIVLLTQVKSIPYNPTGNALIAAALSDPIQAGLNFGAFRAGVVLSASQIAEVNAAAGGNIAPTLAAQGWYLQIGVASPTVRQARGTPPCTFWYVDGQSVQSINLTSVELE